MNDPRDDRYEDGADIARLYHAARRPEPPPAIDRAVQEAARAALRQAPARRGVWQHGLSLAAVLVLTVSVFLLLPRETQPPAPLSEDEWAAPLRGAREERPSEPAAPPAPALPESKREPAREQDLRRRLAPATEGAAGVPAAGAGSTAAEAERADAPAPAATPPADASRAQAAPGYRDTPESWIRKIEDLLAAGEFELAEAEYEAFRQRYPQHPYAIER